YSSHHTDALFVLLLRPPPSSTLFPYTNALPILPPWCQQDRRRQTPNAIRAGSRHDMHDRSTEVARERSNLTTFVLSLGAFLILRSEEHTSELQSRENLVCRLLLEKKKKKKNIEQ